MKQIFLFHLGFGNIGKTLFEQIETNRKQLEKQHSISLLYCGIFTSKQGVFNPKGIISFSEFKNNDCIKPQNVLGKAPSPLIVLDTTASDTTTALLRQALQQKATVILSNKKPLTQSQNTFDQLHALGQNRLFYETTVGAGLPLISTIKTLIATGDKILEIKGCFSGTLGFLCSSLEQNISFSKAVQEAKEKGFTEPDPRDDLSGIDVGRKALILARLIGLKKELSDIHINPLYPSDFNGLTTEMFLQKTSRLNMQYSNLFKKAEKQNNTMRYIAIIDNQKISIGLQKVPKRSPFGYLQGPENIICIKTKRYNTHPLVISGPGAGLEVTAAGVFGDILQATKELSF